MNRAEILLKNINSLIDNDFEGARKIVNETIANEDESSLVSLNHKQLKKSMLNDGTITKRYKSEYYKRKHNKPDNRNYELTGDFINSFNAKAEQGRVQFFALDEKSSFLEKEEDNKILGLTDENKIIAFNKNIKSIRNAIHEEVTSGT